MKIDANGLTFEVLVHEPPPGVEVAGTVLLTMGLGMQLVAWPDSFIQALTLAGQRVVRYDNRDIGLSSHLDALGAPRMPWQFVKHKMGWPLNPPYTLIQVTAPNSTVRIRIRTSCWAAPPHTWPDHPASCR